MIKVHHPSRISSPIGSSAEQKIVARRLAKRFRVSVAHAQVICSLAGIGGLQREAR
jgi:hypothetical protein